MERVAFLLEDSGERLGCLLNPESIVLRRRAGIQPRRSSGGLIAGAQLRDDPLLCTGGGTTELTLDLLFDVSLAGSSIVTEDVRDLTGPLWQLAENSRRARGYGRPPVARFVWGKSWNIPGVVVAVAERLEYFTTGGVPRRSWFRMRLLRIREALSDSVRTTASTPTALIGSPQQGLETLANQVEVYEMTGAGTSTGDGEDIADIRPDQLALWFYGDPTQWRPIMERNGIDDPLHIAIGSLLEIPPLPPRPPSDLDSTR